MTTPRRSRGRPRAADTAERRATILAVARTHFATRGFAGTTLRGIAAEAGVDVALIGHYFDGKSALLVATMQLPVDPVEKIAAVVADGTDGLAERLLHTFLSAWDPHREVFSVLVRTTLGSDDNAPMLHIAREVLVRSLVDTLDGPDRPLRASLVASQLIGLAMLRYVIVLEPVATATVDDLVRLHAPAMQELIG